jgi:hypothetical protein
MRVMSGKHLRLIPGFVAGAMIAGHAGPASTEPQPANPWPPIVFYVAKGDPNACGPGCREWIVAEGTIDRDAPARLRGLLGPVLN